MDRDELASLYLEAGTLSRLGEMLGLSIGGARNRLIRAEIPIQDRRKATTRGMPKVPPTPEACAEWQRRYDNAGSATALGREMGLTTGTICYHLRRHSVKVHRTGFTAPRTVQLATGAAHHNWKGGTWIHADGYICEYAPWHPAAAGQKGYVLQHRLVMERELGRYLSSNELVHHINEDKTDNRAENLELMNRSTHMSHHKDGFPRDANGRFSY